LFIGIATVSYIALTAVIEAIVSLYKTAQLHVLYFTCHFVYGLFYKKKFSYGWAYFNVYSRLDFAGNRRIAIPVVERIVEFVKYSVAYCCDSYKQSEMKQSSVEGRILLW